jgi:hypothetical protein
VILVLPFHSGFFKLYNLGRIGFGYYSTVGSIDIPGGGMREYPSAIRLRARGRMAVHTIWDHLTWPVAGTIDDVPWCAEAISPEGMTAVICRDVKDARAIAVEVCGGDQGLERSPAAQNCLQR